MFSDLPLFAPTSSPLRPLVLSPDEPARCQCGGRRERVPMGKGSYHKGRPIDRAGCGHLLCVGCGLMTGCPLCNGSPKKPFARARLGEEVSRET